MVVCCCCVEYMLGCVCLGVVFGGVKCVLPNMVEGGCRIYSRSINPKS